MSNTFPLIYLPNSTQVVLVDKTRVPYNGEHYTPATGVFKGHTIECTSPNRDYIIGQHIPILASKEEIPGVLRLPEWICKNDSWEALIKPGNYRDFDSYKFGFKEGYEAAGGYTKDDMLEFGKHCVDLQRRLLFPTTREYQEKLLTQWLKEFHHTDNHPIALELPPGPIQSENGYIKIVKPIY